jgi:hypothetical protein
MPLHPLNTTISTWLGAGAGIQASSTTSGEGFWVPKANVAAYVGANGNDSVITNDIRDLLFSILSRAHQTYTTVPAGDTRATDIIISRNLDTANSTVTFAITLKDASIVNTFVSGFGTYNV